MFTTPSRFIYTLVLMLATSLIWGQTTYTWTGASSGAWLTTGNWSPATVPGNKTTTTNNDIAYFNNNTQPTAGINMNTQGGAQYIGAFNFGTSATTARAINNSSGTVPGVFYFNGVTLNGVANTILWNQSTATHNIINGGSTLGIGLLNTTNNVIQITGTGGLTIGSVISGTSKNLTKAGTGSGVLTLSGANTYTGTTTITGGTLTLGVANAIPVGNPGGGVIMNGGTLNNGGFAAGSSATSNMGTLSLTDNSTIGLSGSASLYFASSTAATWTSGKVLTITGWTGTVASCSTGTASKIFIGNSASSLTATQLAQIKFVVGGVNYPATLLSTGELVPTLKLEVTNPSNQIAAVGFSVTVTAKDFDGTARNVPSNTIITLTSSTNTIGGTTTGTINSGSNSTSVSAVTLTAGNNATITATASTCLVAATSGTFNVIVGSGYTVTFNANGGTGSMSPQNASVATALTTNTFTRAGYTFNGWSTVANGSLAYADGASYPFSADITLYARWTANTYTLSFDGNGFTGGSTASQSLATDASASLNLNGFTRTGYTFAGWATTAGGAVAYADGASYTMGPGNATLYAKWTANNNSITFDANTGTGSMGNQTIATAATATLNTNTFTKVGYVFAGWSTTSGGAVAYADGASYTMGTANVTLYAQWTAGPCLNEDFTSGTQPSGWINSGTGITYSSNYIDISVTSGYVTTLAVTNPTTLEFDLSRTTNTTAKNLNIEVSTTSQTSGFTTVTNYDHNNTTSGGTTPCSVDLSAYNAYPNVYIRFNKTTGSTSPWRIDNVKVYCAPACTQPSTQATFTSINNNTSSALNLNFTRGNGDEVLIVGKSGSAPTDPLSGTAYNLSDALGGGNVVYKGIASGANTATTQTIGSLNAETQYYFNIYEYFSATNCYKVAAVSANAWTLSTEPTAHSSTFSCNASAYNQIDLTFSAASGLGADGYIVLQKIGSAPTGLPADATSYSVGNTIGDATVAAIITSNSATTQSIISLTASTAYYYTLVPYNWNGSNAPTYNYRTSATVPGSNCTTPFAPSAVSNIIDANDGAAYTSNINYKQWRSATISNSGSGTNGSVGVFKFIIQDGGNSMADSDVLPTILTGISFTYTGAANTIRSAALFNANAFINQGTVSANGISFSGLSGADVTAGDDGSKTITLRVTFNNTVTDNEKLVFSVSSATAGSTITSSQFTTISAQSDNNTGNDRNRIEVTANRLSFVQEPSNTAINTSMSPAVTVAAVDSLSNRDLDFTSNINITSTGTLTASPVAAAASSGLSTYATLTHTVTGTGLKLYANSSGLTADTSATFNITSIVYVNGDYRTLGGGNWHSTAASNNASWEQYNGSTWSSISGAPATNAASLGTKTVYIQDSIYLVGSNTAPNVVVLENGILNTSTVSATFGNLTVMSGGKFYRNGNGSGVSGNFEVQDNGTVYFSHTNTTSRSTSIWAGTEKFSSNSNFVIRTSDNTSNFLIIQTNADVSEFNGACFGNLIIDLGAGKMSLLPTGFSKTLANNLIFRTGTENFVIADGGTTLNVANNLTVENTFNYNLTFLSASGTTNATIGGNLISNSPAKIIRLLNNAASTVNVTVNGNVEVNSGTLDLNFTSGGTSNLTVKGDLSVASGATFSATSPTSATVKFTGGNTQNVSGTGTLNIYYAEVNKTAATTVNLQRDLQVRNELKMVSGNITTNANTLQLGESTSNKGTLTYTAGYVIGIMKRWFAGTNSGNTGLFPIGVGTNDRLVTVEYGVTPTAGGSLTTRFVGTNMGTAGLPLSIASAGACAAFNTTSTENVGYWQIDAADGLTGGNYDITLVGQGFSTVTDVCQLTAIKRVGSGNWMQSGTHQAGSGSFSRPVVKRTGASGWSNWGFGGGPVNPLPVELISFTGKCEVGDVKLNWSTATEQNSERFIVERSSDLQTFEYVASVSAAGNSNEVMEYSLSVPRSENTSYFRLREEDFDGAYEYFGPISVTCENIPEWQVYTAGTTLYISTEHGGTGQSELSVLDMGGRQLYNKNLGQGAVQQTVDLQTLPSGIYVVAIRYASDVHTFKVVITH